MDESESKLEDQSHKLQTQERRIESNESLLNALYRNLNMPLPPNYSSGAPMHNEENETGEPINEE